MLKEIKADERQRLCNWKSQNLSTVSMIFCHMYHLWYSSPWYFKFFSLFSDWTEPLFDEGLRGVRNGENLSI